MNIPATEQAFWAPCTMVFASAGSGKTFRLTNRIIRLLLDKVPPERILALTFSRAAAGEIFDTMVGRLATAATTATAARDLGRHVCEPTLDPGQCRAALGTLIRHMHLSGIGTLDSFFIRIMRAFPFELGYGGELRILDDVAHEAENAAVKRLLFRPALNRAEQQQQSAFFEELKLASFGEEVKQLTARFDQVLGDCHDIYCDQPDQAVWDATARIWPGGTPWRILSRTELDEQVHAVRAALPAWKLAAAATASMEDFLTVARASEAAPLPSKLAAIFANIIHEIEGLERGSALVTISKKYDLAGPGAQSLARLARHMVGCELRRHLRRTQGMYLLLNRYDSLYQQRICHSGAFTFRDVQRFLADRLGDTVGSEIAYRLDTQYDHWLLDEFQDVSGVQWHAIADMVDEVIQNAAGGRSLFIVGDVKQAIYGWRGGAAWLMNGILQKYNSVPGAKAIRDDGVLLETRRCCPAVIQAANAVFGALGTRLPDKPEVAAAWGQIWQPHATARTDAAGCVQWIETPHLTKATLISRESRWREIANRLLIVRPWEHAISAAVLVRKNKHGVLLADLLRAQGIPVCQNGKAWVFDNPVAALVAALMRLAAHPGDSCAWEHVRMTPLGALIERDGAPQPASFAHALMGRVADAGFEAAVGDSVAQFDRAGILDEFSRRRLDDIVALAQACDHDGIKDPLDFVTALKKLQTVEVPATKAVHIMTMHHSKGLEFDMVFLPELQQEKENNRGISFLRSTGSPSWLVTKPRDLFSKADPVLDAADDAADTADFFEELSLLYVAMTRARNELFIVTTATNATASDLAAVVRRGLENEGVAGSTPATTLPIRIIGDTDWHMRAQAAPAATAAPLQPAPPPRTAVPPARHRFPRRLPSHASAGSISAAALFRPEAEGVRDLGTECHAFLSQIEWVSDAAAFTALLQSAHLSDNAVRLMRHAVATSPALLSVFSTPSHQAELWRETSFELVIDQPVQGSVWMSGTFDRVVLEKDESGAYVRATVYDFKTGAVDEGEQGIDAVVARHEEQMASYRSALSSLTRLKSHAIATKLVVLRASRVVDVPPPADRASAV